MVEAWGDDVPDGKVTDFKARGEGGGRRDRRLLLVRISRSKATRDAANEKMMTDPRMAEMGAKMPFDGKRMIIGGFAPIVDEGDAARTGYADGFVLPVPDGNKEAYRAMAAKAAPMFQEYGATRVVEAWGDDVPDGKVTDFKGAVKAEDGEKVVFSWVEWPYKATRDDGWAKIMAGRADEAGRRDMPFDGKRMF